MCEHQGWISSFFQIVNAVDDLNLDGVDLAMELGCGTGNLVCDDQSSVHLYLLEHLKEELPDKVLFSSDKVFSDKKNILLFLDFSPRCYLMKLKEILYLTNDAHNNKA